MKRYISLFLVWLPLIVMSQSNEVQLLDESLNEGWISLTEDWKYRIGDELNWARLEYDDSTWREAVAEYNNINSTGDTAIAGEGEIIWFRKKIKLAGSVREPIIFNINQVGASEIYLDGELLQTLGVVSTNPEVFERKSQVDDIYLLPLQTGKEQVLAIRYATGNQDYPLLSESPSLIEIKLTTLNVLNSNDSSINTGLALIPVGFDTFLISLGATSLISILFLTLFLFFPKERINGYFALSTLFMSFFLIFIYIVFSVEGSSFWHLTAATICLYSGILLMLFCIYRILDRKVGFWFWTLTTLFLIDIILKIVYPIVDLGLSQILFIGTAIILSIRSLKTNKVAALIFLCCIGLIFIYFLSIMITNMLGIDNSSYGRTFGGLSFMLMPLSIAIYLGYSFSQRSRSLELQLQAVKKLSSENTRILSDQKSILEKQVTERTSALNESLDNLKAAQSQLVQSEKMASLGELTAGIAHEIQNPLNFVNNFSELNKELVEEAVEELEKGDIEETKSLLNDLGENSEKITHHGKRADAIVKGMLAHSRSGKGEKKPTDLNRLAEEYLKLSYHGIRAKDKSFNADFKTDFDHNLPKVNVVPQDIGRVLLNLINNAFQAVNGVSNPTVTVKTEHTTSNELGISITDNGPGIPDDIKEKIFQPFFTTKPTGQGTGLGLSLSYDIVKAHGGELDLESKSGKKTTFTILLPLTT
ncbi:ATP-binding protein [Cryomorphaceae bacterium 1068]|nr:ATP-binding protein [Cryomorphaceae bacterium 1068]